VRPHLRYLARLTPEQRQQAMSATGLPFTGMSLAQQQQFMAFGLGDAPLRSLDELGGRPCGSSTRSRVSSSGVSRAGPAITPAG
jgi:hypothetical protein